MTEDAYLTVLAASLGTSYEPLDHISRADCPLDDDQLVQAAAAGLLPVCEAGEIVWIIAPRCLTARRLASQAQPAWLQSFRLTSSERILRFVARHSQKALGRRAADGLRRSRPLFSNAPRRHGAKRIAVLGFVPLAVTILSLLSAPAIEALAALLCTVFLGAAGLRLLSVAFARQTPRSSSRSADQELPIYTIICALYREANVVDGLVAAIRSLDYPPEKLDVKFVLEADDHDTRRALARLELGPPFEIITAPLNGPRTKPKALNVALPFARGSFTVVYDAEDVPEPDQLRRAVDTFIAADERLACVQAALGPWLRQRTRWYKGWMQTWLVHMRRPARLVRELNPAGAIAFQLFLACNVLAALIHPVFMAGLCWSLFAASPLQLVGAMHAAPVFVATFSAAMPRRSRWIWSGCGGAGCSRTPGCCC